MGRSLPPEPASSRPTLHLFATNFEKDLHNAKCLQNLDGEEVIYKCQDSGEVKGIRGEKEIHIKVNCTVVLIVNLSDDLVNGLSGTVTETGKESVVVYFPDLNRTECIPFYNFTKYDPILKVDIGSRKQLPLTLGYALTVHKAQGVTVDRVVIECKNMFQYGQLTVAVSRVTKKKGLQLKNFSESLLKIPPKELTDFYQRTPLTVMDDKSCCSNMHVLNVNIQQVEISPASEISEDPYDSSEDEDTLLEQVELIEKHLHPGAVTHHLPEDININSDILDTIPIVDPPELAQQVQEKEVLISLQQNQTELHTLIEFLWDEIYSMKEKHLKGERTRRSMNFTRILIKFLSSKDYNARVTCMCTKQELSVSFFNVTFKISQRLRELVLKETVKPIIEKTTQMSEESTDEFTESPDGVGKIRYISGWCVNSVRKKIRPCEEGSGFCPLAETHQSL
ncbi:ATP-dependent DNA helicase PIF7-like [Argopecten irradians]|uniref:ATP-dependent DNA helicase PIF7-like n=1 Tax=Argopecten irradians TaxID=31199 RepID=UPI003722C095